MNNKNYYDYILAIDQGGHASRAAIYNLDGKCITSATCTIETQRINVDGIEFIQHDAKEIVQSIQTVISECANTLGNITELKIKAGFATQRSTIVCWNYKTGEMLSDAISWQDTRAVEFIKKFKSHNELVKTKTGLFLSAHYGVSKINWCLNNLEVVQQANKNNELCVGPLSSYLLYACVAGSQCVVDPANAARTLLLNKTTLDWDEELLNLFEIPKSILPKCGASKQNYGQLIGWQGQCDVQLCTGDQSAAVLSQGIPESNQFTVNIGSGAFVLNVNKKSSAPARILSGSIYTDRETTIKAWEGTVNGAGTALDWLQKQNPTIDLYKQLPTWLSECGDEIPLFINGISGVGSPYWIATLESRFINETIDESTDITVASKAIAVVESIAFMIAVNIGLMTTEKINNIKMSGGLSVLSELCQKISDLTEMNVLRTNDKEATLLGLVFLLSDLELNSDSNMTDLFNPILNTALLNRFANWKKEMEHEK